MWGQTQTISVNILVWSGQIAEFNQEFVAVLEKNDIFAKAEMGKLCPKGVQLIQIW